MLESINSRMYRRTSSAKGCSDIIGSRAAGRYISSKVSKIATRMSGKLMMTWEKPCQHRTRHRTIVREILEVNNRRLCTVRTVK